MWSNCFNCTRQWLATGTVIYLVLSGCDRCLWLLDYNLLCLALCCLYLKSLTSRELNLTRLHQLDLIHNQSFIACLVVHC